MVKKTHKDILEEIRGERLEEIEYGLKEFFQGLLIGFVIGFVIAAFLL